MNLTGFMKCTFLVIIALLISGNYSSLEFHCTPVDTAHYRLCILPTILLPHTLMCVKCSIIAADS